MLGELEQVKQFDVQGLQTESTEEKPVGQVMLHVLPGFREKELTQERQKVALVQLKH